MCGHASSIHHWAALIVLLPTCVQAPVFERKKKAGRKRSPKEKVVCSESSEHEEANA